MRSRSSFRSPAAFALLAVLLVHVATPAQSPPPLFTASATSPAPVAAARSTRARVVAVRRDLLAAAFAPSAGPDAPFVLNLFDDAAFALRRLRLDTATAGHRTWVGAGGPRDGVLAALTLGPAGLSGSVLADGIAYDLQPTTSGEVLVRALPPMEPPAELPARLVASRDPPLAVVADPSAGPVRVDVLVLYTPGARLRAGGAAQVQASLASAVAVTNTAFHRSGVDATLVTVGLQELPYVESLGGLQVDLYEMSASGSMHAIVESVRAAVGADLVALVTGRATPDNGCGVAFLGPAPTAIYSVTEEACLFAGQWSFSHEIGHNFGADHAPDDPVVSPVPYARGYRDTTIRTLMAYPTPGGPPRVMNYSSRTVREPPVTGGQTGNSLQDNARRLNETAATLAAYATAAAPPEPPLDLTAAVAGSTVTIDWTPPASGGLVTSYVLEAGQAPGSVVYGPFVTSASPMVFPNVSPGRYYARVRSVGPGGTSAPTADLTVDVGPVCHVPGPAVVAATVHGGVVALRWSAPSGTGPTRYEVGVGSAPGALDLGVFAVGDLTGASVPAPPGQYFVRARGVNVCGPGGVSPEVRVVVP